MASVPENLRCAICFDVLNQPMQCVRNEHSFCQPCITRYVRESPKCPICNEHLTVETLRPARLVNQLVSQLTVRCDNSERGCPATMKLELFETHVANCEFRPVRCSNKGCEMRVNSKDQAQHETRECRFRRGTCPVCGEDVLYERREFHCYVTRTEMNEVKRCLEETKDEVRTIKEVVTCLSDDTTRLMKTMTDYMVGVKIEMAGVKNEVATEKNEVARLKNEVATLKKEWTTTNVASSLVRDSPSTRCTSRLLEAEKDPVRDEGCYDSTQSSASAFCTEKNIESASEHLAKKGQWSFNEETQLRVSPSSLVTRSEQGCDSRPDIILAGGHHRKSVESFSWLTGQWTQLPDMMSRRAFSSSFVYQQHMFVYGGLLHEDSMEVLSLSEDGETWENFPGKLPPRRYYHASVVYEDYLFIFGGSLAFGNFFNDIYRINLVSPYSSQLVCHLPETRAAHGAQCFGEKIVIVGGTTGDWESDCLDSVVVYDIAHNCCKTLPPLPFAVQNMATVAWRDNIIVVGGQDKNGDVLNTVVCYDVRNGESKMLPAMKHKRRECTAVVTENILVVMGGWNEEEGSLSSVESFNLHMSTWKDLHPMNEKRRGATAVLHRK